MTDQSAERRCPLCAKGVLETGIAPPQTELPDMI